MSTSPVGPTNDAHRRGLAYYRSGNYASCRECADEALAADPRDAGAHVLKGMALIELDRPDEAIAALRQATGQAPEDADGWRHLAIALLTTGDLKGAVEAYRSVLKLAPDDVPALVDLGNALFMLGRGPEALEAQEQAHRLWPGDLPILRNLAALYASSHQPEPALRTNLEVLRQRPGDILALCDAAWLQLELDQFDEASATFRELRRIDAEPGHELYAVHGLIVAEVRRRNWRQALDLAIEATRLDRLELTTMFLAFISGELFGTTGGAISVEELEARFEAEHREHRRSHAETRG